MPRGCGCGGSTTPKVSASGKPVTGWVHEDDKGKVVREGSEVQARASFIRSGKTGTLKPSR